MCCKPIAELSEIIACLLLQLVFVPLILPCAVNSNQTKDRVKERKLQFPIQKAYATYHATKNTSLKSFDYVKQKP